MAVEIYYLDIIGTFAFASYGCYFAMRKDLDLFGILVCAFLTAVGGGTIRELILGHVPFYFFDTNYISAILIATAFTILIYRQFHKIYFFMQLLDALGLVVFALIGASIAHSQQLGSFGAIFFATITAVGGGLLRDIVLNVVPEILYKDFYATVAVLLGASYWLGRSHADDFYFINALLLAFFILRISIMKLKINLWKPTAKP